MITAKMYTPANKPSEQEKEELAEFLFQHLEQFGDPKPDIEKCIDYAMKETPTFGGFIIKATQDNQIVGSVIVNQTGMKDYIPENILVYIATHKDIRGKGVGKLLMQEAIKNTEGSIALHVEPDNPARFLYEKVGFSSKYVEMRLKK